VEFFPFAEESIMEEQKHLNIGLDIDGTLTKYPDFLIWLARKIKGDGGKVYVITGLGNGEEFKRKFGALTDKYGSDWFDEVHTSAEFNSDECSLINKELDNEKIVGRFKQRLCRELNVSVMFDDMAQTHRQFGDIPIFEVK
jgi:hypothetical protein